MSALGRHGDFSTRLPDLPLILASASAIRRTMLDHAGVAYEAISAAVDENAVRARLLEPAEIALELAKAKALDVSGRKPDEWVVGSDSVVSVDGRLFAKPRDRLEAEAHLKLFSGKLMRLTSAVSLARGGNIEWSHAETAMLHVRQLSEGFIQAYLDQEWPEVGACVGVFRLEGRGVQLFDRIEGDYFVILGMPLIPLLGALRERGLVAA